MSRLVIVMMCATGCRQILGLDPGSVAPSDGASDQMIEDDEADAHTAGWSDITLVPNLQPGDQDPSLTEDMLELYFTRGTQIYMMTRESPQSPWNPPSQISLAMGAFSQQVPEIAPDGLGIIYSRGVDAGDLYFATRGRRSDAWGASNAIPQMNGLTLENGGSVTKDTLRIVFASDRDGSLDIYEAKRTNLLSTYDPPTSLSINSAAEDAAPHLSVDGLTLHFASRRQFASAARDLFVTTRSSLASAWAPPALVTELSTPGNDSDPWVSPDGREMYFSSDRDGALRIYHARR